MAVKHIKEWLSEFKALPEAELYTYANTIRQKGTVIASLYTLFESDLGNEMVDPVCHQLFDFYKSTHIDMKRFTLEMIPTLIVSYLEAISQNEKKKCGGIEACLLGIYNLEISDKDGRPKVQTFTIPTLAVPSIYHVPPSPDTLELKESALMRYHNDEPITIPTVPMPFIDTVNSENRLLVLTHVLNCFNADIGNLSMDSRMNFCDMCSRVAITGFTNCYIGSEVDAPNILQRASHDLEPKEPCRIPVSSRFLLECVNGIYYIMFNGLTSAGMAALEDVHKRAAHELFSDVLLVTHAIKNSLEVNPSGQPDDGPMGISIALAPASVSRASLGASKGAITNASFRAKKLPEDLEVTDDNDETDSVDVTPPEQGANTKVPKNKLVDIFGKKWEKRAKLLGLNTSVIKVDPHEEDKDGNSSTGSLLSGRFHSYDIEAVDGDPEAPPHYDDLDHSEASSSKTDNPTAIAKLTKPLKSIMRKGDKVKGSKKDSKAGESPRTSIIGTQSLTGSMSMNGEIMDPSLVDVAIVQNKSSYPVDQVEMRSLTSADFRELRETGKDHRRTNSFPENGSKDLDSPKSMSYATCTSQIQSRDNDLNDPYQAAQKPLLRGISHDSQRSSINDDEKYSSATSLNTAL